MLSDSLAAYLMELSLLTMNCDPSLAPVAERLIEQALVQIRAQNNRTQNPLQAGLQLYLEALNSLSADSRTELKACLAARICQENDLNTRFLLRLISDTTDAVMAQQTVPYLEMQRS